jgi:diguanylate cyclase (GGDEF)-like protein
VERQKVRRPEGKVEEMRTGRVFWWGSCLLSIVFVVLAGRLLWLESGQWTQARRGLQSMERLQQVLLVAEMASRERGPANATLGEDQPGVVARRQALAEARQRTDAALAAVAAGASAEPELQAQLGAAGRQLARARTEIDRIAALPRGQRHPTQISGALTGMFSVIDLLQLPAAGLSGQAAVAAPGSSEWLSAALLAAELREVAGQLGSQFTVALTTQQPMRSEEQVAIEHLRGRIEALRRMLLPVLRPSQAAAAVRAASIEVQQRFFSSAMAFVDGLARRLQVDGKAGMDTAQFAARYVPELDAIVVLRQTLMQAALEQAMRQRDAAVRSLALLGAALLALAALLAAVLWQWHRRLVHPLASSAAIAARLVKGELEEPVPPSRIAGDAQSLRRSLERLRERSLALQELEAEQRRLLERLRDQTSIDYLTGLPNRRGFFMLVEHQVHTLQRHGVPISLALFDIDQFKRLSDQLGPAAGNTVMTEVARLCREMCRRGDILARYGNEEFVLLMPHCSVADAAGKIEQMRAGIESLCMVKPDGGLLQVTASFGVAPCLPGDTGVADAIDRADELLYGARDGTGNRVFIDAESLEGDAPANPMPAPAASRRDGPDTVS